MKEVEKKEVLKWLHTGFIYAIFDNLELAQCKWFLRRVA